METRWEYDVIGFACVQVSSRCTCRRSSQRTAPSPHRLSFSTCLLRGSTYQVDQLHIIITSSSYHITSHGIPEVDGHHHHIHHITSTPTFRIAIISQSTSYHHIYDLWSYMMTWPRNCHAEIRKIICLLELNIIYYLYSNISEHEIEGIKPIYSIFLVLICNLRNES